MIPELSQVYGLDPEAVWSMTTSQYAKYLEHHAELVKTMRRADGSS